MLTRALQKGLWTPCCSTDRVSRVLLGLYRGVGSISPFLCSFLRTGSVRKRRRGVPKRKDQYPNSLLFAPIPQKCSRCSQTIRGGHRAPVGEMTSPWSFLFQMQSLCPMEAGSCVPGRLTLGAWTGRLPWTVAGRGQGAVFLLGFWLEALLEHRSAWTAIQGLLTFFLTGHWRAKEHQTSCVLMSWGHRTRGYFAGVYWAPARCRALC